MGESLTLPPVITLPLASKNLTAPLALGSGSNGGVAARAAGARKPSIPATIAVVTRLATTDFSRRCIRCPFVTCDREMPVAKGDQGGPPAPHPTRVGGQRGGPGENSTFCDARYWEQPPRQGNELGRPSRLRRRV